ncbi:alpha/beta hydrolase [Megasphaera sp. WILCCON 0056]|uniref:alpha/beta hydrolase n=1 Tax=Megasphaera sp. WILCCON 0056 TaxID=3345340 RepID=UPI003A80EA08
MKKHQKALFVAAALVISTFTFSGFGGSSAYAATPAAALQAESQMKRSSITELDNDTRVFKVDPQIEAKNVRFQNRYGFDVAGHLYLPKNFNDQKQYKAVVVSGPFGAVKEQSSGLYAQEMAKNGYVAVAFDPSMTGESSGTRRNMASPDIFTEDYSAAVDFVSNLKFVNPDKIGAIGICGLSGMALTAAANDTRIKAVATSAMYDMSDSIRNHYKGDYYTPEQREKVKEYLASMRDKEAKEGQGIRGYHELPVDDKGKVISQDTLFPDKLPDNADEVSKGFYDYYVGRAFHPRAINSNKLAWDSTTPYGFFNFTLMEHLDEISPRPVLIITGEKAHSKYFADAAYAKLKAPKQEIVVPGATHTDLYDQMDKIPFSELVKFFDKALK